MAPAGAAAPRAGRAVAAATGNGSGPGAPAAAAGGAARGEKRKADTAAGAAAAPDDAKRVLMHCGAELVDCGSFWRVCLGERHALV